eukprot:9082296-Prorocentrum_lima.AAC.1
MRQKGTSSAAGVCAAVDGRDWRPVFSSLLLISRPLVESSFVGGALCAAASLPAVSMQVGGTAEHALL